eukprot:Filipodium_phascolosomae@DN1531_c0_g1_i1.p1
MTRALGHYKLSNHGVVSTPDGLLLDFSKLDASDPLCTPMGTRVSSQSILQPPDTCTTSLESAFTSSASFQSKWMENDAGLDWSPPPSTSGSWSGTAGNTSPTLRKVTIVLATDGITERLEKRDIVRVVRNMVKESHQSTGLNVCEPIAEELVRLAKSKRYRLLDYKEGSLKNSEICGVYDDATALVMTLTLQQQAQE